MVRDREPRGVFAGLATLDVIHRVDDPPGRNEKITARAQFVAAGGPAANAAVTFAALGGRATLVTALGSGTVARAIADDLEAAGVRVVDVAPDLSDVAPVSSVAVTESSGDRSVIGGDAAGLVVPAPDSAAVTDFLSSADVLLVDGHHPELARAMAEGAARAALPIVVDAGRWKPVFAHLLPQASDVVASADLRAPGAEDAAATRARIRQMGVPTVVTTAGGAPVRWWSGGSEDELAVPTVPVVDTLAAGDVFHGAYAFALARGAGIRARIAFASEVAATRCTFVGPRSWLSAIRDIPLEPR